MSSLCKLDLLDHLDQTKLLLNIINKIKIKLVIYYERV